MPKICIKKKTKKIKNKEEKTSSESVGEFFSYTMKYKLLHNLLWNSKPCAE